MRTRQHDTDATAIDQAYISTFLGLNESELQALLTEPSTDLVTSVLHAIARKAEEYDTLKAEKLQVDVELENVIRTSDAKVKAQKAAVTRQHKEIEDLRSKLNEVETARETLVSQLGNLQTNASDSTVETQALRSRVTSLESSNRDLLALLESRSTEKDRVHKDLEEQHSKVVDLRREVGRLEEQNHSFENQSSSLKFKEQHLRQELELSKKNNDRQAEELRARHAEYTKFRKERNAHVNAVERQLEDSAALVQTLQQSDSSLRIRLEDAQAKTEEAFQKSAHLQEAAAKAEQTFKSQIETVKRLADLHAQSAATHKARLEDLEGNIERMRDDAAEEIVRLQTEVETERADKVQAEQAIAHLELRLETQERSHVGSIPGTPLRNGNGNAASPSLLGSAQKAARSLTNTQLYSQWVDAKQDLEHEERRTAKLQAALDDLIQEMESRAPELLDLRQEQERLESEILQFSRMLDDANETRDVALRDTQKWQTESSANAREGETLRQQLRDMSAQVKMLLVELQSKEQGMEDISVNERLELERAARGELDGRAIEYSNSTQQLISERLVIFRNVAELQGRNEQLLRLTRELGDKMEGEEAREQARQSAADALENTELRAQLKRYKDEMQSTAAQIDSYMKERDMFRRMLQHRGTIVSDADTQAMFGQSLVPATPQRNGIEPATPRSKDVEDLNKLLKEQQKFFDQYRNESATDRRMLNDQVDTLVRDRNTLQLEVARAQSQLTLAGDRYELLQTNLTNLRTENAELQKRSQVLSGNAAKQDLRTQQVAEELVEARSLAESLRADNANGKAEKDLWKRIETRLNDENKNLMDERSRLSKLNTDLSNLANERERTENEARRRLQTRLETIENELTETKRRYDDEVESSKKVVVRREYEETQNRTRIDDLAKSLSYTREELAAAKTLKDQLQSRVDEMKIELRAAEEKAVALQPRPSTRANGTVAIEDELSAEQRLAVQLSDAKRDLDFARSELDSAREQIEQYKTIAQTTEEELANFNQTSEQYREEADAVLAAKEASIEQFQQRIEDLTSELTATNTELSDLRTKHDDASQALASQRATLEEELAHLKDDAERHDEEKRLYQQDLKAQAEIAQQAQQSYEFELVKHADAARSLQTARQELNDLRIQVAGIRAEAEAAKANLESGQESWSEQKDSLQREISELAQKRRDIDTQNKILHQQLETFSSELEALRQGRAVSEQATEDGSSADTSANLQGVITFLRREKEIIEAQHELASQESRRLQQQLDYANTQADELHVKLAEERKQNIDRANSEASTSKLAQTINELNLFRESAVTLRNEARQARERLERKDEEMDKLSAELQPLQSRLGELEADVEVKESEIKLITTDRDHWRERTKNIISKYDRVDPAELEELRTRIESLQTEKEQLQAEQSPLREQIEALELRITEIEASNNERIDRFKDQAKQKARDQNAKYNDIKNDLTAAQAEQTRLTEELDRVKQELTQANDQPAVEQAVGLSNDEIELLRSRLAEADAQASVRTVEVESLQGRIHELEQQVEVLAAELAAVRAAAENQDDHEQGEIVEGDDAAEALTQAQQDLANAQQDLASAQQEITQLHADHAQASVPPTTPRDDGQESDVATAVAQLRKQMEEQHALAIKQVQDASEAKINTMRNNLQRQLRESKAQLREELRIELVTEHSAQLQAVREEYEQTINTLRDVHSAELERLKQDGAKAASRLDSASTTGTAQTDSSEFTDEYVNELMKNNTRVRTVMASSLRKNVAKETEKLSQALADKDAELIALKDASKSSDEPKVEQASQDVVASQINEAAVQAALDNANKEKEAAVRQAIENAEKKAKVQLSQRDLAQAKIAVVQKAAQDTPKRAVSEVWEEAKKARPTPKPAPATAAAPPIVPAKQEAATSQADVTREEDPKLKARRERFGNAAGTPPTSATTSGQPDLPDGSQPVSDSSAPNPQAASFVPGTAARGGASGIPTANRPTQGGFASARGNGHSIQGAASRNGASGIARGGAQVARPNRGGPTTGAGIKRQHEGGGGGDGKRVRGGGPNA